METPDDIAAHFRDMYAKQVHDGRANRKLYRQPRPNFTRRVELEYGKSRDSYRSAMLKSKFGIDLSQWEEMFDNQGRCCGNPGCRSKDPRSKIGWHTDHCHATGRLRAILCHGCNVALGNVRDNVNRLKGLIEYLEYWALRHNN